MESPKPIRSAAPAAVAAPDLTRDSKLALIHPNGSLKVGDTWEEASRIFVQPPSAYTFNDLPRGFQPPYRAKGWEYGSEEGFGAILYQNEIALALRNDLMVREDLDDTRKSYEASLGKPSKELLGAKASYWFWEDANQRLMISAVQDQKQANRYRVTVALGDRGPMNAIRASLEAAKQDQAEVEKEVPRVRNPG